MRTHLLGYPRIGSKRELKKACERYWSGKISTKDLLSTGRNIREQHWQLQKEAGIDLIPSNDFSFYDQVLDMSLIVDAIPKRYRKVMTKKENTELDLYFAMARGYQNDGLDLTAMEMTKWFDTNYHYIVPEFTKQQQFKLFSNKIVDEFYEAKKQGVITKPVILGPVSFLLLGKEKEKGFHRIELLGNLLPVYMDILRKLEKLGVEWVQFDEPFLTLDLSAREKEALLNAYTAINKEFPHIKTLLATYFGGLRDNLNLATSLPVTALHLDLVRAPEQWTEVIRNAPKELCISLGIVDGRNIWKNDFKTSLALIENVIDLKKMDDVFIAPSCSLLHSPCDLDLETNEEILTPDIKNWLSFAKQKVHEVVALKELVCGSKKERFMYELEANSEAIASKQTSPLIHNQRVKERENTITDIDAQRNNPYSVRGKIQQDALKLPLYPTTTIGSFPQTAEVRQWRAKFKKKELTEKEYEILLKSETKKTIQWQEEIGMDVLVHGEFERNDMVEYFGERLNGFTFTKFGWVQSYGSRCVKPPIIYGDVHRPNPMTVEWSTYAQSLTPKLVKGMLTGPVTILQWSFVRNDQPRWKTCNQIAMAVRDEVQDLEKAGIKIIQIDEPAIREGLPLRKKDWQDYLQWAVGAFRIASSGVKDETQIHTHMCYSEFNDMIEDIAHMDADVITIECSRSQMELLDVFAKFNYPNAIGPGVYDIHSPRVPDKKEMVGLLEKAEKVIPIEQLWVNPDCGLKTRHWKETQLALEEMVNAAKVLRENVNKAAV